MGKNNSSARILFFLLTFVLYLPAEAQDRETSAAYSDEQLDRLLLAQHGFGWGQNLQPPLVSIEACARVENIDPNSSGPPRCVGRGGLGRNGFWNYAPWILVHFKGLTPGKHKLFLVYWGVTKREVSFENNETGWWLWFQSAVTVGKPHASCYLYLYLDFPTNSVGDIHYSGSFE